MYILKNVPDKLFSPEYYMETEGYDIRLAVLKMNDFLETLGDAYIGLTYANPEEHPNINELELAFIRRIHLRHAVIDLNNCFDLLLQISWFFYRIWNEFNPGGSLYQPNRLNNGKDWSGNPITIIRNNDGWVETAEESCSLKKVLNYFSAQNDPALLNLIQTFESFKNTNIFNSSKSFTVRTIANQIKHKHSLKVKEINKPFDFNVDTPQGKTNLRDNKMGLACTIPFFDEAAPNTVVGNLKMEFKDDLYIDIEYNSGEKFRAKDYIKNESLYSLDEIHKELINYANDIIDLFEDVSKLIDAHLEFNPLLESAKFKSTSLNLDKFFK
ncbi:hypothetical protein SAMN05444673_2808 [Bacillus sp. OV166]|uniref:hypothetical protein n=1 Tax=Bacillus sp. OV166 TaxID=1882763 RepID=UPI000A2AAEFD|nr:hypothetical protein [Bacillus sp. OV166]SMQ77480.1 hypothetical protein SAMN05444673_2808 [Bacillus sp. OV166]